MIVEDKQVFNLWDTNGRRSDVLNALSIYIGILKDLEMENPGFKWASYPDSTSQYDFYVRALSASPEVFQKHDGYDEFVSMIQPVLDDFQKRNITKDSTNQRLFKLLDESIEQRARHYTSNLVRIGLATDKRKITPCGNSFYNAKILKDSLEEILPLNETNIILLRQLMKLRVFTKKKDGAYDYYSPFFMAIYLLLNNDTVDKNDFIQLVQGLNPYLSLEKKNTVLDDKLSIKDKEEIVSQINFSIPNCFINNSKVTLEDFSRNIKNRKSGKAETIYYDFYDALFDYVSLRNDAAYDKLKSIYIGNKDKIRKAFCLGKTLFDFGTNGVYSHFTFVTKNSDNPFLNTENLNSMFYEYYEKSKHIDVVYEYSDTTMRMLGATGLVKTKSAMIELSFKSVLSKVFSNEIIKNKIFGSLSEEEYVKYEKADDSILGNVDSILQILEYSTDNLNSVMNELKETYNVHTIEELITSLDNEITDKFNSYISQKYTKEKVVELLTMFSDRSNDSKIKKEVNESADVPTIYEFIVGIAWYYISNKNFNLYNSLNLTLNADFEPEMHAGGGMGDIVISYPDKSIMLEVTLMNKSAQKRGEWEPVLRHSINNKVANGEKESMTFFIADELDYNTINIWRAVAAVPLQSSLSDEKVNGVIIMPFNNSELCGFLNKGISSDVIIGKVRESYKLIPQITDDGWRTEILSNI